MAEMTALQKKWADDRKETLPDVEETTKLDPKNLDESLLERIPKPTGWRMVVLPFRPPKKNKRRPLFSGKSSRKTTSCYCVRICS